MADKDDTRFRTICAQTMDIVQECALNSAGELYSVDEVLDAGHPHLEDRSQIILTRQQWMAIVVALDHLK